MRSIKTSLWANFVTHLLPILAVAQNLEFPARRADANAGIAPGLGGLGNYKTNEAVHSRTVYFVGGLYVHNATDSSTSYVNQMMVEQLVPAKGVRQPNPLVLFHGGGLSGTTWLQTPDNRKGWASFFLDAGYAVFLVDISLVGRSSRPSLTAVIDPLPVEVAEAFFSHSEGFPQNYPQAKLHTQWPGAGVQGDPSFDAWYPSILQFPAYLPGIESAVQYAGCKLLQKIGPSFLIGHSIGGIFPWVIADQCTNLVKGIFGIEPDTPPFQSYGRGQIFPTRDWGIADIKLTYDPPVTDPITQLRNTAVVTGTDTPANRSCLLQKAPARKLTNIAKVPVYFYTTPSSIHITYDHCLAAYLWQAGVSLEWQLLSDLGIKGNGHFSFVEKNNLQLAAIADQWFKKHSGKKGR